MFFKIPKDTDRIFWTRHVKKKMRQYRLSEMRIKRVLRDPERKETGVAPRTTAVMQSTGSKKHPTEIWLMYQIVKLKVKTPKSKTILLRGRQKLIIISAWRYPGTSPKGKLPPIPEDILQELKKII
jgi:hypothetical protein